MKAEIHCAISANAMWGWDSAQKGLLWDWCRQLTGVRGRHLIASSAVSTHLFWLLSSLEEQLARLELADGFFLQESMCRKQILLCFGCPWEGLFPGIFVCVHTMCRWVG